MTDQIQLSVAIPTYQRESVLIDTIDQVLSLAHPPREILVVDQTQEHEEIVHNRLAQLQGRRRIRWIRLAMPSIPRAMNMALLEARSDILLFLDDDVDLCSEIVREHWRAHSDTGATVVVGRVRQPWATSLEPRPQALTTSSREFDFDSDHAGFVDRAMAGNMSVKVKSAIAVGGFDENFVRVAYRFEDDFVDRIIGRGGKVYFCPTAKIRHLKHPAGGTRSFGSHLRTIKPTHAVGAYYYLMKSPSVSSRTPRLLLRPIQAIVTRYHLSRPWWIPVTLVGEIAGFFWAWLLLVRGPKYLKRAET